MKSWKTLAIMAVLLTLVMTSFLPVTIGKSEQNGIAEPVTNLISSNDGGHKEISIAGFEYWSRPYHLPIHIIHLWKLQDPYAEFHVSPNTTIDLVVEYEVHDDRFVRNQPYNVHFEISLNDEKYKSYKDVTVPEGVGKFKGEGGFVLTFKGPSLPGIHKYTYSLLAEGPCARKADVGHITLIVGTEESIMTPVTTAKSQPVSEFNIAPNVQPTPSTTPSTTNSLITKLFETISEQISNANNAEQTPSTTPNHQATPYTSEEIEDNAVAKDIDSTRSIFEEENSNY